MSKASITIAVLALVGVGLGACGSSIANPPASHGSAAPTTTATTAAPTTTVPAPVVGHPTATGIAACVTAVKGSAVLSDADVTNCINNTIGMTVTCPTAPNAYVTSDGADATYVIRASGKPLALPTDYTTEQAQAICTA